MDADAFPHLQVLEGFSSFFLETPSLVHFNPPLLWLESLPLALERFENPNESMNNILLVLIALVLVKEYLIFGP